MSFVNQPRFPRTTLLTMFLLGCVGNRPGAGWDVNTYRKAIQSGRQLLTVAADMEGHFSNTEHMLIMYGSAGEHLHEWQTVSFFGGRYELTMSVTVSIGADGDSISHASGDPTFIFTACRQINPTGGASLDSSRELKFGLDKWQAFKLSGYDIKVLDPAYDGSTLPGFEEYANGWQESRRVWR